MARLWACPAESAPPPLCPSCAFLVPYAAILDRQHVTLYRCLHAIRGAPERRDCRHYQREPGADDA